MRICDLKQKEVINPPHNYKHHEFSVLAVYWQLLYQELEEYVVYLEEIRSTLFHLIKYVKLVLILLLWKLSQKKYWKNVSSKLLYR